jgi:hypothetical protein
MQMMERSLERRQVMQMMERSLERRQVMERAWTPVLVAVPRPVPSCWLWGSVDGLVPKARDAVIGELVA